MIMTITVGQNVPITSADLKLAPNFVFEGLRTSFSLPLVAVLIATQVSPLQLSASCHLFTYVFSGLKKKPQNIYIYIYKITLLNCPFNIVFCLHDAEEAAPQLAQGQTPLLMSGPQLMYIGMVWLVPKELHQFTEGTGTDNSALLHIALTGPPNYLLKECFIFLLLSKAKFH